MRRSLLGLLIPMALCAAPVSAQSLVTPKISNTAGQRDQLKQLICKVRSDASTRIRRKMCGTREQWDAMRDYGLMVAAELLGAPMIMGANSATK